MFLPALPDDRISTSEVQAQAACSPLAQAAVTVLCAGWPAEWQQRISSQLRVAAIGSGWLAPSCVLYGAEGQCMLASLPRW